MQVESDKIPVQALAGIGYVTIGNDFLVLLITCEVNGTAAALWS